jgi:hypothetical protein
MRVFEEGKWTIFRSSEVARCHVVGVVAVMITSKTELTSTGGICRRDQVLPLEKNEREDG